MHKIAIFSFGNYGKFFKHVVDLARKSNSNIQWSVIASNYQAAGHYRSVLEDAEIKYLFDGFTTVFESIDLKIYPDICSAYNEESSIWRALAVDKMHYKRRNKDFQITHAISIYKIFKGFLEELKPVFVIFPIIESHDGFILYDLCKELNIQPIVYGHARNIGGSFFTDSFLEYLPFYADSLSNNPNVKEKAYSIIKKFREEYQGVRYSMNSTPSAKALECQPDEPAFKRLYNNFKASLGKERYNLKINYWIKLLVYFQKYNNIFRKFRYSIQQKRFDICSVEDLPKNFIYFPLQFSPESSINVPDPYYIDQMRVIDEILFKYSNGRYVVVKEHPAMMGVRPTSFYSELERKAGVLTCDALVKSEELIERADLTVSVTGTAVLEAFLLGKPCLLLGNNFLKPYLDGRTERSYSDEEIIRFVASVIACTGNFILYSPGAYGRNQSDLFNQDNVNNFLQHLLWHINKVEEKAAAL